MKFTTAEKKHMQRAITIAKRAAGNTSPNPMVGCVLVKGGKVVAEGYHKRAGLPHAEVEAIQKAGSKAKGCTAFVTLEPCNHKGRTAPCTDALIAAGIKNVVAAIKDPNPLVAGSGLARLKRAGITVKAGLLSTEATELNKPYIKYITTGLPYITLKAACSLDGKIADKNGYSKWISNEASRKLVHKMRAEADGIIVGVGTVLADNPQLNTRPLPRGKTDPIRIVVDSGLRIPLKAKLLNSVGGRLIIATGRGCKPAKLKKLEKLGAEVIQLPLSASGKIPLRRFFKLLAKQGLMSIIVEGGSTLYEDVIAKQLADRAAIFIAPIFLGGSDRYSLFKGNSVKNMEKALKLKDVEYTKVSGNILIEGKF